MDDPVTKAKIRDAYAAEMRREFAEMRGERMYSSGLYESETRAQPKANRKARRAEKARNR